MEDTQRLFEVGISRRLTVGTDENTIGGVFIFHGCQW